MLNTIARFFVLILILALLPTSSQAYPKPSPYPISWDFKFEYQTPKRIVVRTAAGREPEAFWYMTFTVTNPSAITIIRRPFWKPFASRNTTPASKASTTSPANSASAKTRAAKAWPSGASRIRRWGDFQFSWPAPAASR